jgi:hypothetical protein
VAHITILFGGALTENKLFLSNILIYFVSIYFWPSLALGQFAKNGVSQAATQVYKLADAKGIRCFRCHTDFSLHRERQPEYLSAHGSCKLGKEL